MAHVIRYIPKFTAARTQYREISPEDHAWLINYLIRCLVTMGNLSNAKEEDLKTVRDLYWRKRRASLPRGRNGQNTPESLVAGVLDNMLYSEAPQRDFSDKQMEAIEDISRWMSAVNSDLPEISFLIGFADA